MRDLFYGAIQHNLLPGVDAKNHPAYLRLALPLSLPFLGVAAYWIGRMVARIVPRQSGGPFSSSSATIYYGVLYSVWTLLTRQDFLPFYPVMVVVATPWILHGVDVAARRFGSEESARLFA